MRRIQLGDLRGLSRELKLDGEYVNLGYFCWRTLEIRAKLAVHGKGEDDPILAQ